MTKNIFLTLLAILALSIPAGAQTDPQTIQFLEKLNLYYYSLGREGLKQYSCELIVTLSDEAKSFFGCNLSDPREKTAYAHIRFTLRGTGDGQYQLSLVAPPASGDPSFDQTLQAKLDQFRGNVDGMVSSWVEGMVKSLHDQDNYKTGCEVKNGSHGFTVKTLGPHNGFEAGFMEYFDPQARLYKAKGKMNGVPVTEKSEYIQSPKGYVISSDTIVMGDMSIQTHYENQVVGRYWMPNRISTRMIQGDKSPVVSTFVFSNTEVSP
jgi:hypothetical protein